MKCEYCEKNPWTKWLDRFKVCDRCYDEWYRAKRVCLDIARWIKGS